MFRYVLKLMYDGTHFFGLQGQKNVPTIQGKIFEALKFISKQEHHLVCCSRTDAGVHALVNYFHFDSEYKFTKNHIYNLNSMIGPDIVCVNWIKTSLDFHCRYMATYREYEYHIQFKKNPFKYRYSYYFPYKLNQDLLNRMAKLFILHNDYSLFSKKHSNTKTNICYISKSFWTFNEEGAIYTVRANRFLRGMVKALVGTMLDVGRSYTKIEDFEKILEGSLPPKINFSPPSRGLILKDIGLILDSYPSVDL